MTGVAWVFAVAWVASTVLWVVQRSQIDRERRAERSQFVAAVLARTPSEFTEAVRRVDPVLLAQGPRRPLRRGRRKPDDDDGPQVPIGL